METPTRPVARDWLVLVSASVAVAHFATVEGPAATALPGLLGVVVAVAIGLGLKSAPAPLPRLSSIPVGVALLAEVVTFPPSFPSLVLGVAAGLVTLLWAGLGHPDRAAVPGSLLGRELFLPIVGGAIALLAAGIPLLHLLRPAALVITAFAGLALLIVLVAELAFRPAESAANGEKPAHG